MLNSVDKILLRLAFLAFIVLLALLLLVLLKPLSFLWFAPYLILMGLIVLSTYSNRVIVVNRELSKITRFLFTLLSYIPLVLYIYVWLLGNEMEDSWKFILASGQFTAVLAISSKLGIFSHKENRLHTVLGLSSFVIGLVLSVAFLIPLSSVGFFMILSGVLGLYSLISIGLIFLPKS